MSEIKNEFGRVAVRTTAWVGIVAGGLAIARGLVGDFTKADEDFLLNRMSGLSTQEASDVHAIARAANWSHEVDGSIMILAGCFLVGETKKKKLAPKP